MSKVPLVRQIDWFGLAIQLAVFILLILFFEWWLEDNGVIAAAFIFIGISFFLKNTISRHHRNGINKTRQGKFAEAIPDFEKSFEYFSRNPQIDKYRYLTLLSASKMSYREMALCNMAFCYSQLGNGGQAKTFYQRTLELFPGSTMASTGLKMLESMEKDDES